MEHGQRFGAPACRSAAPRHRAAAFVHEGGGLEQQDLLPPIRPSCSQPWNFFCTGPKPCMSAITSTAMKPTLCRCMRIARSGIAEADPDLHGTVLIPAAGRNGKAGIAASPRRFQMRGAEGTARNINLRRIFVRLLRCSSARRGNDGGDGEIAIGDRAGAPLGRVTLLMWIESPTSLPVTSISISPG
jgi:hypothetical protein